jgi:hypothetical protein
MPTRIRHPLVAVGGAVALSGALVLGLRGGALAEPAVAGPATAPVAAGEVAPAAIVQADRRCHRNFHCGGWEWDRFHHRHLHGAARSLGQRIWRCKVFRSPSVFPCEAIQGPSMDGSSTPSSTQV